MLHKTIIIFAFLSFFTNNIKAQQQECPDFEWLSHLTSTQNMGISNLKQDNLGSIYICGTYLGTANIGIYTLPPSSGNHHSGLIAKFDSLGNCIWAKSLQNAYITSIAGYNNLTLDTLGNIYLVGIFRGTAIIQDDTLMPTLNDKYHGIITKLDTAGNLIWNQVHTNLFHYNIEMMSSGNIYIISQLHDTAVFDTHTLVQIGTEDNLVVSNINSQGTVQWIAQSSGANATAYLYRTIAKDVQDNLYIGGPLSNGMAHFGSHTLDNTNGQYKGFVIKITPQGQFEWANMIEGQGISSIDDISVSPIGDLYVTGNFRDSVDFDGIILFAPPNRDNIFLARLTPQGQFVQVACIGREVSATDYLNTTDMSVDEYGDLYVTGGLNGNVIWGDTTYTSALSFMFITKIQPQEDTFRFVWTQTVRSQNPPEGVSILCINTISSREHYIAGAYKGDNLTLGNLLAPVPPNSIGYNAYFAKLTNDCSLPTEKITSPLQSVTIYPNPANTNITIINLPLNSTINITDISGRVLYTQYNKQNNTVQIPVNGIGNGMYFVQIINGENMVNKKVAVRW